VVSAYELLASEGDGFLRVSEGRRRMGFLHGVVWAFWVTDNGEQSCKDRP